MKKLKTKNKINEVFDKFTITLCESKNDPIVDGVNIIGKVEGPGFVPNGFSRNKRFYPDDAYKNAIAAEECQRKLKDRMMLGCFGHDSGDVTEKDVVRDKVSHFIDNKRGCTYFLGQPLFVTKSV